MRNFLSILFYTVILAFLGALAIAFAFHLIDVNELIPQLLYIYKDVQIRIITGASGFILVLLSLAASHAITGRIQREKTIAFSNPNGQVTVTLSAVEDIVKRLCNQLSELKDAKANVRATKKGIDIHMKIVLRSETNIPDFTARLQDLISSKIHEIFGIDEPINVKIHVAKIITSEEKSNKKEKTEKNHEDVTVPYRGIKI